MAKHGWVVTGLVAVTLCWHGMASAQTPNPSPEALAAAKELMTAAKMADQLKQIMPSIMQALKPLVTKNNPQAERDYDALLPVMLSMMEARLDDFIDEGAKIHARHFTAEEMREVTKFLRTPAGTKQIQQQPEIAKESMAMGQRFGQEMAQDFHKRMIEELRKRGHNI